MDIKPTPPNSDSRIDKILRDSERRLGVNRVRVLERLTQYPEYLLSAWDSIQRNLDTLVFLRLERQLRGIANRNALKYAGIDVCLNCLENKQLSREESRKLAYSIEKVYISAPKLFLITAALRAGAVNAYLQWYQTPIEAAATLELSVIPEERGAFIESSALLDELWATINNADIQDVIITNATSLKSKADILVREIPYPISFDSNFRNSSDVYEVVRLAEHYEGIYAVILQYIAIIRCAIITKERKARLSRAAK